MDPRTPRAVDAAKGFLALFYPAKTINSAFKNIVNSILYNIFRFCIVCI